MSEGRQERTWTIWRLLSSDNWYMGEPHGGMNPAYIEVIKVVPRAEREAREKAEEWARRLFRSLVSYTSQPAPKTDSAPWRRTAAETYRERAERAEEALRLMQAKVSAIAALLQVWAEDDRNAGPDDRTPRNEVWDNGEHWAVARKLRDSGLLGPPLTRDEWRAVIEAADAGEPFDGDDCDAGVAKLRQWLAGEGAAK